MSDNSKLKIMLLEDDDAIGTGLKYSLETEGYDTILVKTVRDAIRELNRNPADFYILDLTLPDGSGYDVCRAIKERSGAPVIFLTAFDDEVNVVMGLELGADDYVSKPFRLKELLARIKSVMRRYTREQSEAVVSISGTGIRIHTNEMRVYKGENEVELTAMEYRLLLVFAHNRGMVLTRNQILENLWDVSGDFVNDNTLTVYIKRLRDKIEEDSANPEIIKTVRGIGYIME